jgi:hypothetical protein
MNPIAILHEGNDKSSLDNKLIKELMAHLKLDIQQDYFYPMGVKSNFFKTDYVAYKILKERIEKGQVTKILFIIDADSGNDGGFEKTKEKLENIIKELKIENISQFYIMRNLATDEGYVESFILSTIPKDKMDCINKFLECSGFVAKQGDKSTYERIYKSVAHPLSPYNFEHENFKELKQILTRLFQ